MIAATDSVATGFVYAFDRDFGEPRWKRPYPRGVSAMTISSGNLAAVTALGELVLLDAATGIERWRFTPEALGYRAGYVPTPIIAGDVVFLFAPGGKLRALALQTGALLWMREADAEISTSPALSGERLSIGLANSHVVKVRAVDGDPTSDRDVGARPFGAIATDELCSYILTSAPRHSFFCLGRDLTERWERVEPEGWSSFRPAFWRHAVVIGDETGEVYALNRSTGAVEWTYRADSAVRGITVAGDIVYLGTIRGLVIAIDVS